MPTSRASIWTGPRCYPSKVMESLQLSPIAELLPQASTSTAVTVDGKFLSRDGERFWIKGVTYGSFSLNEAGEPYPPFAQLLDDFAYMKDSGINTVRLYSPPSDRIADAAADAGLM